MKSISKNKDIVWLRDKRCKHDDEVGFKTANLSKLISAGFRVPEGFCLTAGLFEKVLSFAGNAIIRGNDKNDINKVFKEILNSERFLSIRDNILQSYRQLSEGNASRVKVAVRSSSLSEDMESASFAGQYVSVLNVSDEEELLRAIVDCWTSAFSSRVNSYKDHVAGRMRPRLKKKDISMGVLVQVMVPAELSGIMFTFDPINDSTGNIVMEVIEGLGDKLAEGTRNATHIKLDRHTLNAKIMAEDQANFRQWIDIVKEMSKLGLMIEKLMGVPQDIEWAYADKKYFILQSRPITTVKLGRREVWTRANAGEILPGVVSPLTWSIFKPILQKAGYVVGKSMLTLHYKWVHPCGIFPDSPKLFNGRAYMELSRVYASFASLPGVSAEILQRMLGFEFNLCLPAEFPRKMPRRHIMDIYRKIRYWLEMLNITNQLSVKARKLSIKRSKWLQKTRHGNKTLNAMVINDIDQLMESAARILGLHIQCTSMAFSAFGLIYSLLGKYIDPKDLQKLESVLISDFNSISTVQQTVALWRLAQLAKNNDDVKPYVFRETTAEEIIRMLSGVSEASEFVRQWKIYMNDYGDRSSEEFELSIPHWDEDGSFVMRRIRDIVVSNIPDPEKRLKERRLASDEYYRTIETVFRERILKDKKWYFKQLVSSYKKLVALRENMKYLVVCNFNDLRKSFLSIGEQLEVEGALNKRDDIFYLNYDEITKMVKRDTVIAQAAGVLIEKRKDEHDRCAREKADDVILIKDRIISSSQFINACGDKVLSGIGCSSGQFTGPAYLLKPGSRNCSMPAGHILIATSIDPGLTPLFLHAAAVVTEIGGALSHSAIVAREYGLPAVVGVANATNSIRNEQIITVDGTEGKIYLSPRKDLEY